MSRKKLILLLVIAAILVGVQLTGLGLAGRKHPPKSIKEYSKMLGEPRALSLADLADPDRCIVANAVRVQPGRRCMVTADSTWGVRRRVLSLRTATGTLEAQVVPLKHVDRDVTAQVDGKGTDLPVDREGARIVFRCEGGSPCIATVK